MESAIERAARTLLDLRKSWEWASKDERKDLVHMMIQEVGVDVVAKRVLWVKAHPDFDVLFQFFKYPSCGRAMTLLDRLD